MTPWTIYGGYNPARMKTRAPAVRARRGRPLKFGRPARPLTVTLPHDVVAWLERLHPDPAWAIVRLYERARRAAAPPASEPVELVQLPGRRALILVRPEGFGGLPGVSLIPLQDGRAFLALEAGRGLADLELALLDRSEDARATPRERANLAAVRARIKAWRQEGVRFETRSIIMAQRGRAEARRTGPLSELKTGMKHEAS